MNKETYEEYLQSIEQFLNGRSLVLEGQEVKPMSREEWGSTQEKLALLSAN